MIIRKINKLYDELNETHKNYIGIQYSQRVKYYNIVNKFSNIHMNNMADPFFPPKLINNFRRLRHPKYTAQHQCRSHQGPCIEGFVQQQGPHGQGRHGAYHANLRRQAWTDALDGHHDQQHGQHSTGRGVEHGQANDLGCHLQSSDGFQHRKLHNAQHASHGGGQACQTQ